MIKNFFRGKVLAGLSMMAVAFVFVNPCSMVVHAGESSIVVEDTDAEAGIMPYSDIIEYRYKVVDGTKLYRRLYNYTQQYWIGEWEYLGEGYIEPGL